MGLKRIVIATDFSAGAIVAVQRGLALACHLNAEVLLAHACSVARPFPVSTPDSHPAMAEYAKLVRAQRQEAAKRLDELCAEQRHCGISVRTALIDGPPAKAICRAADELDAGLIITGSRGLSNEDVFVIGSVAEAIVHRSERNVLVMRGLPPPQLTAAGFDSILVATDLTSASRATLPLAMELATKDADVEVLHVIERGEPLVGLEGNMGNAAVDFKMLWSAAVGEAQRAIDSLARRHKGSHATLRHHIVEGKAAHTILHRASSSECGLLVVGKRTGHSVGAPGVAERMVRHAPCSVLVAKKLPAKLEAVTP